MHINHEASVKCSVWTNIIENDDLLNVLIIELVAIIASHHSIRKGYRLIPHTSQVTLYSPLYSLGICFLINELLHSHQEEVGVKNTTNLCITPGSSHGFHNGPKHKEERRNVDDTDHHPQGLRIEILVPLSNQLD